MPDPEALARIQIDRLLTEAGWKVVDRDQVNPFDMGGIAIREVSITGAGEADYLLMAERKAIGIIEAKAQGITLSGVEPQTKAYAEGIPGFATPWISPLPMLYESTGVETRFTNLLDPDPRSRRVFAFHRPEALVAWVKAALAPSSQDQHGGVVSAKVAEGEAPYDAEPATLAGRLQRLPLSVDDPTLWPAQLVAITNLEQSLRQNKPRALIQMATGSGKTFTAISAIYRLIRDADAKRMLFLVDRANLGRQTFREFQAYRTPDDGRTFTELYNVQHLRSNVIDTSASRVCISTIQRIYSILTGDPDFDESLEEGSTFEGSFIDPKVVTYNPAIPIETFDVIVIDEAHRSIFNLWSQVLEYFDAYLIGLTATPNKQAFAFFNQNLVMEYTHEDAVADNVNVPFDIYPIKTRITQEGGGVEAGYHLQHRDRKTRAERWQQLDEDYIYAASQIDRDVVVPDQIRTVVRTFRDKLFTEIFPGRTEVPKTLIFAKDDFHADDIVRIVREEFGKGNDFCQKITYRTTGIKPEDLLAQFRNNYNPRIVVTVDMIATGTDVKPIEIVMFMRTVKSPGYFEQMKGRGVRVMPAADLRRVTADATAKTHFVIVDAVGVTEVEMKDAPPPLERKRSVAFKPLIERIAFGQTEEANLTSLAFRLAKLDKVLSPEGQTQIATISGGQTLGEIVRQLLAATDPDVHLTHARQASGLPADALPTEAAIAIARAELAEGVQEIVANPDLRNTLIALQEQSEQVIDSISQDEVLVAGFSTGPDDRARATTQRFSEFITDHQDEITALQITYGQPYAQRRLHFADLKELAARITAPPRAWTPDALWDAYAQLDRNKVRKTGTRTLTDLVSLVRYATGQDDELVPFEERVAERFTSWLGQQEAGGRHFTTDQHQWLTLIRDHIAQSTAMEQEDFDDVPFAQHGGLGRFYALFGDDYLTILDDLNGALVA